MVGFGKEINSLLKKMKSRKGCGVEVSRGNWKFSSTRLERKIQKLECSMNYNCSLLSVRDKGGSNGVSIFSL